MKIGSTSAATAFPGRFVKYLATFACAVALWSGGASFAADVRAIAGNKGVVELETGGSSGISIPVTEDLAGLFDDAAVGRVLPVVGRSALQNLWDLVQLRGIDMAILQTDVLDAVKQDRSMPGVENNFSYITKLYNEEFHLLAGPDVKSIADLAHKRVNVGTHGSGTSVTAARLFDLLKIPVEETNDRDEVAIGKLRSGDIAAMAFVAGKPSPLMQGVHDGDHLHFVPVPLDEAVIKAYVPTTLTSDDYPALIGKDQPVDTVAVGTILAAAKLVPASDRYKNVSNFVDVFFTQFRTLLEPGHHPKWKEINLAADAPGWNSFSSGAAMARPQRRRRASSPARHPGSVLPFPRQPPAGSGRPADHGAAEAGTFQPVPTLAGGPNSLERPCDDAEISLAAAAVAALIRAAVRRGGRVAGVGRTAIECG